MNLSQLFHSRRVLFWPFAISIIAHFLLFLFIGSKILFQGYLPETYPTSSFPDSPNHQSVLKNSQEELQDNDTNSNNPTDLLPKLSSSDLDSAPTPDNPLSPNPLSDRQTPSPISNSTNSISDFRFIHSIGNSNQLDSPFPTKKYGKISKILTHSEESGASSLSLAGIEAKSKAVAICIDVSRSMVADRRGGIKGYQTLKKEVQNIINGLNEETTFTLILFSKEIDIFRQRLTSASPEAKREAIAWLEPYMKDINNAQKGNLRKNYRTNKGIDGYGSTRTDLAVTAAFEQGADAIFIVSDGAPAIWKNLKGEEKQKLEERRKNPDLLARRKAWYDNRRKQNEARQKKGLPPIIDESGFNGWPMPPRISNKEILDHIEKLYHELYEINGRRPPIIHCVGYVTNTREEAFMKKLTKDYNGKLKNIDNKDLLRKQKRTHPKATFLANH